LKNYFHILGLKPGASESEIRNAFRALAKKFHPDVNPDESARLQFIEVQQAYEFLMDSAQRRNYEILINEQHISRQEQERREQIYRLWVEHQQRQARMRTAMETVGKTESQSGTSRRIWKGVNTLYNIFFLAIFLLIFIAPIKNYIDQQSLPLNQQRNIIFFIVPSLLGAIFVVFGYYFWFVAKTDEQ
jgi:curved DNA-binding protein CbpA